MIRATGIAGGRRVVLLGLELENLMRLANNEPIRVNLSRLDPSGDTSGILMPDIDIVIFDVKATPPEDLHRLFEVEP